MPNMRKTSKEKGVSYYKKRADELLSKLVREKQYCEWCGRTNGTFQCSHVVGRGNLALRYDILNVKCLCAWCHLRWHANPLESSRWFKSKYPQRYEYLMANKNKTIKRSIDDYKELIKNIKERNIKKLVTFYQEENT